MTEDSSEFRKHDGGKPRLDLLPFMAVTEVGKVMTFGAQKYGDNNWREAKPDQYHRYEAAAYRHLFAYSQGELIDPESGLPHLAHAATNLLFLLEFTHE